MCQPWTCAPDRIKPGSVVFMFMDVDTFPTAKGYGSLPLYALHQKV